MNKSKIEWCDSTWNPVTGCLHKCEYFNVLKEVDINE
jgi:protein gp37